ncbi:hypothetical protein BDW75DRAFT_225882 [Aspergillus navahoensis]
MNYADLESMSQKCSLETVRILRGSSCEEIRSVVALPSVVTLVSAVSLVSVMALVAESDCQSDAAALQPFVPPPPQRHRTN